EIFDKPQGFGTTSFVQNINRLRALEGELARTVSTLGSIRRARIHLVLPRREAFSRDETQSSASVFLEMVGGKILSQQQILAVQHMVAAAVPQLKPTRISIIDASGNLLARGGGEENSEMILTSNVEELRRSFESHMVREIEDIVASHVGYGKVRASVAAEIDFDRISTNEEIYDPDSQVARSTKSVEETSRSADRDSDQAVSVSSNLPGFSDDTEGSATSSSDTNRLEETVNYEISKTIRNHIREGGQIKKLSVAVLIDGSYTTSEKSEEGVEGEESAGGGEEIYHPRSAADLASIEALIRSAVGFNEKRGDQINVVNMRFHKEEVGEYQTEDTTLFGFDKAQILRMAEQGVLLIVGVLVVLLVIRPLVTRLSEGVPVTATAGLTDKRGAIGTDHMITDRSQGAAIPATVPESSLQNTILQRQAEESNEFDRMIDIQQVEGRVRESSLKKIGEIVEKHPNEAVSILRQWMSQEG
ncbi:MAG: flagellar basal-body MS-ring/collar protein FliF, partial [Pseudomonadota bacterium]|nr:flagellar basal-body MS-ring/collar protein FliF [Pseudomonadota bacterium]